MVIKDVFGVIYAPHKTFKRIAANPKYLAIAIIVILFISLQTTYYYSYYSKVHYEQTVPPLDQLSAFTAPAITDTVLDSLFPPLVAKPWTTPQGASITINDDDYIEQNFYGNNSLQFILYNGNSLSATLEQFGYTANCDPEGFTSLNLSLKPGSPDAALPTAGTLTLYTANGTSNYFTRDITSMLTNNYNEWNNLTIPVGTPEWQTTGTPNWSEITGLQLTLTYSEPSHIHILLQGIFFRGQYLTQVNAFGTGSFLGFVTYSIGMQIIFQWLILAAIAYIIFKCYKATNVVWRSLFIVMGFTLMVLVVIAAIALLSSLTLQTVYYPYDFPPYGVLVYPDAVVNGASPASQIAYESIVATTNTYTTLTTVINIFMYVLQAAIVTFAVKAVSGLPPIKKPDFLDTETSKEEETNTVTVQEFSYTKSLIVAISTVVLSAVIMAFLAVIGLF
ncbi:MAG: hypothetical protein FWD52_03470 [Candidatus Bathyarchaeota archaeon]|nr:hypothetical protein [Candidatus Termiticorpusculum sp.]